MADFTLVTPVYKDAERLAVFGPRLAQALSRSGLDVCWVISDDGSGPSQLAMLHKQASACRRVHPHVEVFALGTHRGKGAAVREAWKAFPGGSWLAFVDADGSIRAETVVELLRRAAEGAAAGGAEHAVLGSRTGSADTRVERGRLRAVGNAGYAWLVRACLGLGVRDPQCGVKVIPAAAFAKVTPGLREDGLAFDAELLVALRQCGVNLHEVAIDWADCPGGPVHPLRDAWPMFVALMKIIARYRSGSFNAG